MTKILKLIPLIALGIMLNGCAWKAGVEDEMANAAAAKNKTAEVKAVDKNSVEAMENKASGVDDN